MSNNPVDMYEVMDALEAALTSATQEKRDALRSAIEGYSKDFPDDFFWAIGPQAPVLLYHLLMSIDIASSSEGKSKARVIRLIDRKPEGTA